MKFDCANFQEFKVKNGLDTRDALKILERKIYDLKRSEVRE